MKRGGVGKLNGNSNTIHVNSRAELNNSDKYVNIDSYRQTDTHTHTHAHTHKYIFREFFSPVSTSLRKLKYLGETLLNHSIRSLRVNVPA